jgi:hypothetical protein
VTRIGICSRFSLLKLLDALNAAEFESWTLVDAMWTSKRQPDFIADNRKAELAG